MTLDENTDLEATNALKLFSRCRYVYDLLLECQKIATDGINEAKLIYFGGALLRGLFWRKSFFILGKYIIS